MAHHGLSVAEWIVLSTVELCDARPATLYQCVSRWSKEVFPHRPLSEGEADAAVNACFARNWIAPVDVVALQENAVRLQHRGILGPVFGMPQPGRVDFTAAGAEFFTKARDDIYGNDIKSATEWSCLLAHCGHFYYLDRQEAENEHTSIARDPYSAVGVIEETGPWMVRWWETHPRGYRFEITVSCFDSSTQRPIEGGQSAGTSARPKRSPRPWDQIRGVLGEHGVDPQIWTLLAICYQGAWPKRDLLQRAEAIWRRRTGAGEVVDWVRELDACFDKDLLLYLDATGKERIRNRLSSSKAIGPIVSPFDDLNDSVDLTESGLRLYRMIRGSATGIAIENSITTSDCSWEIRRYWYVEASEAHKGRSRYQDDAHAFSVSEVRQIGAWCPVWWQIFERGYFFDVEYHFR